MHGVGYVHKDLHPGNIFAASVIDEMNPWKEASTTFKVGDLGITRLLSDVDFFNTVLAEWMVPPEFLNPAELGLLGWNVDIYDAGLLFLSLLLGTEPSFTRQQILDGAPRRTAEGLSSPFAPAIARALRRRVADRTPTALDFWRDLLDRSPAAPNSQ